MNNLFVKIAGISGALAVAAGAIGAHAMIHKPEAFRDTWKKRIVCGSLFLAGIILFSVALMEQRKPFSYPAPIGGFCLMGGWLALAIL
eukprot:gene5938-11981_t